MKERGGFRRDIDAAVSPRPTLIVVVPALMEDIDVVRRALEGGESCVGQHVLGRCVGVCVPVGRGHGRRSSWLTTRQCLVSPGQAPICQYPPIVCARCRDGSIALCFLIFWVLLHARGRIRGGGYTAFSEAAAQDVLALSFPVGTCELRAWVGWLKCEGAWGAMEGDGG